MKILHHNRLVDITGFHQASAEDQKLVISYPPTETGCQRFPDEFIFSNNNSATGALLRVSQYCNSDCIVEFAEDACGELVTFLPAVYNGKR